MLRDDDTFEICLPNSTFLAAGTLVLNQRLSSHRRMIHEVNVGYEVNECSFFL